MIITLYQQGGYELRKFVARMREGLRLKLNGAYWISNNQMNGDFLTKMNIPLSQKPSEMLSNRLWDIDMSQSCELDANTFQWGFFS